MCRNNIVPKIGAILSTCLSSACFPIGEAEDGCIDFAEIFQSVAVEKSFLEGDFLNNPLPDNLRRLEAGYDPSCVVGGVGDVHIQCATAKTLQSHAIIRTAPVIGTDPEGFSVLVISREDHEKLKGQELFWAKCSTGT